MVNALAMTHFFKLTLRTSDVDRARSFYTTLLGDQPLDVVQLHEQAVARGARPHWLGCIHVDDVDRSAAAFIERGATSLGPKWVNAEGLEAAVVRDPGGAVVALAKPRGAASAAPPPANTVSPEVVWYGLHTADVERAKVDYHELFGWELAQPIDAGALGIYHPFAWERGASSVGFMADISGRSTVHPHWLFHFRVASIAGALEVVRGAGGLVIGPLTLPDGEQVAVCDDPQGAAFALRERP